MNEARLLKYYKTYVKSKYLYRVVSEEHVPNILKDGLNPKKNPFQKQKKDFYKLFKILIELKEKHNFLIMRWWGKSVDQIQVINCTKTDLENNFIDFTPCPINVKYYKSLIGGALVSTIFFFTEELLLKQADLIRECAESLLGGKDLTLIKKLNRWAKKKRNLKNKVIWIKASSLHFEEGVFQCGEHYYKSPFGSYTNFKKAIQKNGFQFYKPYFEGKKLFYVRISKKIPSLEIVKIK